MEMLRCKTGEIRLPPSVETGIIKALERRLIRSETRTVPNFLFIPN